MGMTKHPRRPTSATRRQIIILVILLLLLYGVVPRLDSLGGSLDLLMEASPTFVVAALVVYGGVFIIGTIIYVLLAAKPLRFMPTLVVQVAAGLTGKLLPAGLGTLGLMVQYLRASGHTTAKAVGVVGVNNLLGLMGHGVLLLAVLLLLRPDVPALTINVSDRSFLIAGATCIVLIGVLAVWRSLMRRIVIGVREIKSQLSVYSKQPLTLLAALGFSIGLTILYTLTLYLTGRALGHELPVATIFLVFSLGTLVATATPTPGGAIGAEAGLAAGFTAYGLPFADALAIALLYRLITYWLPLLPGSVAFVMARSYLKL